MKPPASKFTADEVKLMMEKHKILARKVELQQGLPFLYGWPWYRWAKEFFDCTHKMRLLVAANQISKSSTQIRLAIDWATNTAKWPLLWRTEPRQFWYMYPTAEVATIEFDEKWVPEFLPQGKFKDDPVYGWEIEKRNKNVFAIHFNSQVSIYFKTYSQDVSHLQSGTVNAIFCDEELPAHLYDELQFRLAATDGYFSMVFTATLGQDFWRQAMEGTKAEERFPSAWKRQISMYDCQEYIDGTPTPWTKERINQIVNGCRSQAEILKRVFGRFVVAEGRKYQGFDAAVNVKPGGPLDPTWRHYAGVDIGSGGEENHPAAIVFVTVCPEGKKGRVFRGWRGDKIETNSSDILAKYIELRGRIPITQQFYDWGSVDFKIVSQRMNEPFIPADKGHVRGEDIVNVLFKNRMLSIDEGDPELQKLVIELATLRNDTNKRNARDDLIDALRYAVTKVFWDFSILGMEAPEGHHVVAPVERDPQKVTRPGELSFSEVHVDEGLDYEFEEWNSLYGE